MTPDALCREDRRRFELVFDAMLAKIENFHIQYANGQLQKSNQGRFAVILRLQFDNPGVKRYRARWRHFYTARLAPYVETELGLASKQTRETSAQKAAAADTQELASIDSRYRSGGGRRDPAPAVSAVGRS